MLRAFPIAILAPIAMAAWGYTISGCDRSTQEKVATATPTAQPALPDLVVTDIVLKAKAEPTGPHQDECIINVVIQNKGAAVAEIAKPGLDVVRCGYECNTPGQLHSSTWNYASSDALKPGETAVLGDDAWLSVTTCPPAPSRQVKCKVDPDNAVLESDEANNERTEVLQIGR